MTTSKRKRIKVEGSIAKYSLTTQHFVAEGIALYDAVAFFFFFTESSLPVVFIQTLNVNADLNILGGNYKTSSAYKTTMSTLVLVSTCKMKKFTSSVCLQVNALNSCEPSSKNLCLFLSRLVVTH